jgi:hypothetical protein
LHLKWLGGRDLLKVYLVDWNILSLHRFIFIPSDNHQLTLSLIFDHLIIAKLRVYNFLVLLFTLLLYQRCGRSKYCNTKAWLNSGCILMALLELRAAKTGFIMCE